MLHLNQLIGFGAASGGGPATSLTTLTQKSSATSINSANITAPSDIAAGDLLVLVDSVWVTGGLPPASSKPSGFTQITTVTQGGSSNTRVTTSYKVANGSEASATLTGMTGTGGQGKVLLVFSGNIAISSIVTGDIDQAITDSDPAAQTITASGGTPPLIVFAAYTSSHSIDPRTFTVSGSSAKDGEVEASGTQMDVWLAWKIYNSSPADVVADMDDEGFDNGVETFYLQAT